MDGSIEIATAGGNCPVQIEGTVDGVGFYFRARGSRWSVSIGGQNVIGNPDWYHEEPYGSSPFEAGWMDLDEAKEFLAKAIDLWRSRDGGGTGR